MKLCHKYLNGSELLTVFNLTELSRSCSKWIINILQLSQLMLKLLIEFLDIYLKNVPENLFYKEPCFNPIQDGPFWGCSCRGEGAKSPP